MFLAPNFFGGGPPEFFDLHYQEHIHCDHAAKFRGDRPTELGGSPANKKKHLQHKRRLLEMTVGARFPLPFPSPRPSVPPLLPLSLFPPILSLPLPLSLFLPLKSS